MVETKRGGLFSYKPGNSFFHRTPAWVKILFVPALNILFFLLPPVFSLFLILIQAILAFALKFTVKEQVSDLKPVIYYAFMLVFVKFFGLLGKIIFLDEYSFSLILDFFKAFWPNFKSLAASENETILLLLKLFCVMQSASLIFKTSTSLEIREGIGAIECKIRRIFTRNDRNSEKNRTSHTVTNAISLFLNFIPMVSKIWNQSKRAWLARGGKNGVKMYITLLPVLFSVGMKKAWNTARAVQIRS